MYVYNIMTGHQWANPIGTHVWVGGVQLPIGNWLLGNTSM